MEKEDPMKTLPLQEERVLQGDRVHMMNHQDFQLDLKDPKRLSKHKNSLEVKYKVIIALNLRVQG